MTRLQVRRMILAEAGIMGLIGGLFGLVMGLFMSRLFVQSVQMIQGIPLTYMVPVAEFSPAWHSRSSSHSSRPCGRPNAPPASKLSRRSSTSDPSAFGIAVRNDLGMRSCKG